MGRSGEMEGRYGGDRGSAAWLLQWSYGSVVLGGQPRQEGTLEARLCGSSTSRAKRCVAHAYGCASSPHTPRTCEEKATWVGSLEACSGEAQGEAQGWGSG